MAYKRHFWKNKAKPAINAKNLNEIEEALLRHDQEIEEIVKLPPGSTQGNAELVDIRVGADGNTYPSAGDAVREQLKTINNALNGVSFGNDEGGVYVEVEV